MAKVNCFTIRKRDQNIQRKRLLLTLSWRRYLSDRNQFIDLLAKQATGFYMIGISFMKELKMIFLKKSRMVPKYLFEYISYSLVLHFIWFAIKLGLFASVALLIDLISSLLIKHQENIQAIQERQSSGHW